jgi:hypothetical protein
VTRFDDASLDALFQAPLAEFTAARNALARSAGAGGAAIRAIEKPSAAAWAVNQVYWQHRRVYDRLVRAAERLRSGHARILKGQRVDLAPLDLAHRAAAREAGTRARDALVAAASPPTPATVRALQDTLLALPAPGPPGRLTRPLGPVGFEALGGLLQTAGRRTGSAEIVTFARPKPVSAASAARKAARDIARARAEAAARDRRRRTLEANRRRLEDRLRTARLRVGALTQTLEEATAEVARLVRELQAARDELSRLR